MSHTRIARGTTGKGQHQWRRPQDTVDFTPHICKGNRDEPCRGRMGHGGLFGKQVIGGETR